MTDGDEMMVFDLAFQDSHKSFCRVSGSASLVVLASLSLLCSQLNKLLGIVRYDLLSVVGSSLCMVPQFIHYRIRVD